MKLRGQAAGGVGQHNVDAVQAELLARVLGKNPETTVVVIDEVDTDNWGIGGKSVSERRKEGR
ncbi:tautomerase enzyme family protein [Neisseria meningitidis 2004032]|nr:tautomerase enzyme family protein [Neisseria meningitidis 2004032]